MRQKLLLAGTQQFPLNTIVTNGTIPLPDWRERVVFAISIDGPKEYHDQIRGNGKYELTRRNVLAATGRKMYIHTVLNRFSWRHVEEMVADWLKTNVKGIGFSLHTPLPNIEDKDWIPWEERQELVEFLCFLKKKHGSFILQTEKEFECFLPNKSKIVFGDNCLVKKGATICLDTRGTRKLPCVMGNMDCERCGCAVPVRMYNTFYKPHIPTILLSSKII